MNPRKPSSATIHRAAHEFENLVAHPENAAQLRALARAPRIKMTKSELRDLEAQAKATRGRTVSFSTKEAQDEWVRKQFAEP